MNALADKVHKQEVPCTQRWPHYSSTISISSSGMPIGTKFTATYVGMVVEVPLPQKIRDRWKRKNSAHQIHQVLHCQNLVHSSITFFIMVNVAWVLSDTGTLLAALLHLLTIDMVFVQSHVFKTNAE